MLRKLINAFKSHKIDPHQQKWDRWKIQKYRISLQLNWEFLNFDRDILSDMVCLEVDEPYGHFLEEYTSTSSVDENYLWTIGGLFEQVDFYPEVQYDLVDGFPKRLGNQGYWVVEVKSFLVLEYKQSPILADRLEDIRHDIRWIRRSFGFMLQWHYLSTKYYLMRKRQTISLKEYLMTGSFGGIRLGNSESEVVEILGIRNPDSGYPMVMATLEVGFQDGIVTWYKYNCNKFQDRPPYPPTVHVKGFAPEYDDTTLDEFIAYLEFENMPYEVIWEHVMDVQFPIVYVNDATKTHFAENKLTILGIYPKGK